jgi:hypothetical protein
VQIGGACTSSGIPGTWDSNCTCVTTPQHFITGIDAQGSTSNPLLWGTQFGNGFLMNLTSNTSNYYVRVNASGCLFMNTFEGLTSTCNLSGSGGSFIEQYRGTFNATEQYYVYNSTDYLINFNETLLNQTIDSRSDKVKVTSSDTLAEYLDDKIQVGGGLTKLVGGIPQRLTISSAATTETDPLFRGNSTLGYNADSDWSPQGGMTALPCDLGHSISATKNPWFNLIMIGNITNPTSGASCTVADACTIGSGTIDYSPFTNNTEYAYLKDDKLYVNITSNVTSSLLIADNLSSAYAPSAPVLQIQQTYPDYSYFSRGSALGETYLFLQTHATNGSYTYLLSTDDTTTPSFIQLATVAEAHSASITAFNRNAPKLYATSRYNSSLLLTPGIRLDGTPSKVIIGNFGSETVIEPYADDNVDLGNSSLRFRSEYLSDNLTVGDSTTNTTITNQNVTTKDYCFNAGGCFNASNFSTSPFNSDAYWIYQKNSSLITNLSNRVYVPAVIGGVGFDNELLLQAVQPLTTFVTTGNIAPFIQLFGNESTADTNGSIVITAGQKTFGAGADVNITGGAGSPGGNINLYGGVDTVGAAAGSIYAYAPFVTQSISPQVTMMYYVGSKLALYDTVYSNNYTNETDSLSFAELWNAVP